MPHALGHTHDVGAAEAIDGLLGVTDQKERPGADLKVGPVLVAPPRRAVATQTPEDFGLQRVGVLELIDQHVRKARRQRAAHVS